MKIRCPQIRCERVVVVEQPDLEVEVFKTGPCEDGHECSFDGKFKNDPALFIEIPEEP
jgi:hypothetical protein